MSVMRQLGKAVFITADLILPTPRGPRILIYHQVGAGLGRQTEVTTEDFVWQLNWLAQNRQVVSLEEALERWEEEGSEKLVVLTFDDGYSDTYTAAFPKLKERGFPFAIYLTTETLGYEKMLTWKQVEEMVDTGLATVGAHTHRHRDMRYLSEQEIAEEIDRSNRIIEARIGLQPNHFAYPWGYWSATADPIVRSIYSSAVLGAPPLAHETLLDRHLIHRFPVQLTEGQVFFQSRLKGGLLLEEAVRRRLRGYNGP
jgi:peptidoglycan/xylan/chitin deacetylase (PgdA/CDA1 family)